MGSGVKIVVITLRSALGRPAQRALHGTPRARITAAALSAFSAFCKRICTHHAISGPRCGATAGDARNQRGVYAKQSRSAMRLALRLLNISWFQRRNQQRNQRIANKSAHRRRRHASYR